jgi:NRPS condensation-like uncharacterized protein
MFQAGAGLVVNHVRTYSPYCRSEKEGYAQAVIKKDLKWTIAVSHLDQFLEDHANIPMRLSNPLSLYTIVTSNHGHYFVWTAHHAFCDGSLGASVLEILDGVLRRIENEIPLQPAIRPGHSFVFRLNSQHR